MFAEMNCTYESQQAPQASTETPITPVGNFGVWVRPYVPRTALCTPVMIGGEMETKFPCKKAHHILAAPKRQDDFSGLGYKMRMLLQISFKINPFTVQRAPFVKSPT